MRLPSSGAILFQKSSLLALARSARVAGLVVIKVDVNSLQLFAPFFKMRRSSGRKVISSQSCDLP